jgi:hypothetical protein
VILAHCQCGGDIRVGGLRRCWAEYYILIHGEVEVSDEKEAGREGECSIYILSFGMHHNNKPTSITPHSCFVYHSAEGIPQFKERRRGGRQESGGEVVLCIELGIVGCIIRYNTRRSHRGVLKALRILLYT